MEHTKADHSETRNSLTESSERRRLLKTTQGLFAKDLSEEEVKFWLDFLKPFSLAELRYAFENWHRNGRFFPKPKDVSDLVEAYRMSHVRKFVPCGNCTDGWLRVYSGRTAGGRAVDPNVGAVTRCGCFQRWAAA